VQNNYHLGDLLTQSIYLDELNCRNTPFWVSKVSLKRAGTIVKISRGVEGRILPASRESGENGYRYMQSSHLMTTSDIERIHLASEFRNIDTTKLLLLCSLYISFGVHKVM